MTARRAASLLLCCGLLAASPWARAAPQGTLTITGSTTAYAMLKVTKTVTYDLDAATVDYGDGVYGGFAVGRDFATLYHSADARGAAVFRGRSVTQGVLTKGTYPVRLFAAGKSVTVRIPWSGPNMTLTPAAPFTGTVLHQQAAITHRAPDASTSLVTPLDGRKGMNTRMTAHIEALVAPSVRIDGCLAHNKNNCKGGELATSTSGGASLANRFGVGLSDYDRARAAKPLYARATVSKVIAGLFTLITLQYHRDLPSRPRTA